MREFRWSWADVGLLKSGLAKAGAGWHSADRAGQAIEKLERLKLKDRARPLHFIVKGKKEFRFADAGQAVAFLRPLADADALRAVKTRKPLQDVDQLLGELPDAQKARISRSLHCPSGHPIQRKGESLKWYQDAKTCDACRKPICAKSDYWRCTKNCKYNVCHHCFQDAGNNAALLFAEHCSESLANTSQASTSEGPPSDEVLADGPCVELTVHFQGRRETAAFDSARPLAPQMSALEHALHSEEPLVLVRRSGAELEVLQSELQLQAIPPGADVAAEPVTQLVASHLAACESGDAAPLRQLVAIVCAKEELATEVLNQGGLSVFLGALRAENAAAELASTGLCAFLQHPRRRAEVVELLSKDWQTYGPRLMPALLRALVSDGPPARASMALLLWLLEEVEGAPGAFHAAAMRQEADDGAPGYRQLAATAHGAAALRRAQQKAPVALRESMCEAVDAEVHGGFMEDLLKEESSHEVLSILTASCATPQAACTELQRQQATQIKEEKKFTEMLQGKLRQSHRALQAMAPLVKLGDADLERTLASILQNGWESAHWPEGQTLLHFLCEHSEDPRAVQLVSELCPDLEARDEKGLRAMDYAMQNPSSEVADQLLKVSRARACQSFGPLEDDVYGQNLEVIQEHEPPSAVSISDPKLSEIKQSVVLGKDGETEHGTIGALFVLRTQLSAALRENEALKDKVGELELLRTRLAILSEERGPVAATGPLLPAEIAEKRERGIEIQEVSSLQRVSDSAIRGDVAGSDNISASASECEPVPEPPASVAASSPDASPTPREVPTEAASPKLLAPPRGKAKGKGKGPQLPSPSPSPSEGSSAASDIGDATPTPSSSKGKGKSKGPPPAPGGRPAGAETGEKGKGKGKGKAAVEPTKPTVKPMQDLKTLPWTRYVVGAQLQQGTIWDKVNFVYDEDHIMESLPLEEIEKRFGKSAGLQKVAKAEVKESKKPKTVKIDSITQQQRFQIEVSLRTLPVSLNNGAKAAQALKELDRSAITAEALQTLRRFLCPSEEQEMELSSKRQAVEVERSPEDPFVWDPVEQFMEDLAQVRGCAMRLSCWGFLYNLPDRLSQLQDNLQRFEKMVRCFLTSVEIPFLLSLVLAFGNYLNGGKNEKRLGQADGFHVELLGRPGGLDVVNDAQGCNLRQLIFTVYCEKHQGRAEQLLRELAPMFGLVQRRLGKDAQGVPQIRKSVRVQIEELDKQLMQLKSEFSARHQELKDGLKQISDPADKFVVEVPPEFERARQQVEDLVRQKDTVVQQFKLVLANFKAETYRGDSVIVDGQVKDGNPKEEMTSEVWCKIWDDFFVPGERVLTFDEKRQKELIEPHFCKDSPLTVESLAILWGLPSASLSSAQRPRAKAARRRTTA